MIIVVIIKNYKYVKFKILRQPKLMKFKTNNLMKCVNGKGIILFIFKAQVSSKTSFTWDFKVVELFRITRTPFFSSRSHTVFDILIVIGIVLIITGIAVGILVQKFSTILRMVLANGRQQQKSWFSVAEECHALTSAPQNGIFRYQLNTSTGLQMEKIVRQMAVSMTLFLYFSP